METGLILAFVTWALGIAIGILIGLHTSKNKQTQGILNVDYSDPEDGPYLFLELNTSITDVVSRKQAVFNVHIRRYISHE